MLDSRALPIAAGALFKGSPNTLWAFGAYLGGVFLLGGLAHHLLKRGSFLKEYFLGDRKLNSWVLALTYVATSVSAGSFVGFPSFIYTYGWIMALWIAGYMMAGLVSKGVLAKRLNQVSRLTGAITVPDVLRDRFRSPALGLMAGVFLVLFLVMNLVAQFKAGGLIMRRASMGVGDTAVYQEVRGITVQGLEAIGAWDHKTADRQRGQLQDKDYPDYVLGVLIFALTVVAYTTYGGFWAVTWTDVLQGLVIVAGALFLMGLALYRVGSLGEATATLKRVNPDLLSGPGPNQFLPLGLAISFFFLWTIGGMGQPVGMVRLMACPDTPTLRRSLFMIGIFYALIYLPLVVTFICARALFPTEFLKQSDDIMPSMALALTQDMPLLGGLILAAPYAAAMSAVAGFLLLMSSSLVRDIYQRNINPTVSVRTVKRISYGTTAVVGLIVTFWSLTPPTFLQYVIIFSTSGMGCTFLAPTVLALYWRRATRPGALAAMLGGFFGVLVLYVLGWLGVGKPPPGQIAAAEVAPLAAASPLGVVSHLAIHRQTAPLGPGVDPFTPLYLFGLDPLLYGLMASFGLGIGVSLLTRRLPASEVDRYFLASAEEEERLEGMKGVRD